MSSMEIKERTLRKIIFLTSIFFSIILCIVLPDFFDIYNIYIKYIITIVIVLIFLLIVNILVIKLILMRLREIGK